MLALCGSATLFGVTLANYFGVHRLHAIRRIVPFLTSAVRATDPDGIRTRVAALKGPCPRPLDDGAKPLQLSSAS